LVRAMRMGVLALGGVLAAACASAPQKAVVDRFDALDARHFRYTVTASVLHPINSEQAEHGRLVRLDEHLHDAGMCRDGYRVVERSPPLAYGNFNKRVYERVTTDVTYLGVCGE